MKALLAMLIAAGLLAPAHSKSQEQQQQARRSGDAKELQGEWQVIELQWDGKSHTSDNVKTQRLIFRGEEFLEVVFLPPGGGMRESKRKFTLDLTRSPKEIDIAIRWVDGKSKDQAVRGIFSLEKSRLMICSTSRDGGKRPTAFKTSAGDGCALVVYERVSRDPAATLEFLKIRGDWDRAERAWFEAEGKAKTAEERRKARAEKAPKPEVFAERYLKLAEAQPDTFVALVALCWAADHAPLSEPGKKALAILQEGRVARADPGELKRAFDTAGMSRSRSLAPLVLAAVKQKLDHAQAAALLTWVCSNYFHDDGIETPRAFAEAADLIAGRFAESPDIFNFCECLGMGSGSPPWAGKYEKHLRTILDKNRHRIVRSRAQFALASVVQGAGEARQDEAEKLYRRFVADFSERPKIRNPPEEQLLDSAKAELEEIRTRGLGKLAPDLAGEDLDGRPMKLSDFRGKVVLLSFWATWCGPCMKLIPHEQALVANLKNKPFALVGVNGDTEPAELRKALQKTPMPWRSFKDKRMGRNTISDEWKISGWPTLYLIDHQGVIRKRWIGAPATEILDREIATLVEAALRCK